MHNFSLNALIVLKEAKWMLVVTSLEAYKSNSKVFKHNKSFATNKTGYWEELEAIWKIDESIEKECQMESNFM